MAGLHKGSSGEQVLALQAELNTALGLKLDVDGDFGEKTYKAVRRYQSLSGLYVDGIADRLTLVALGIVQGERALVGFDDEVAYKGRLRLTGLDPVHRPGRKPHGYKTATLRPDAADSLARIRDAVHAAGGLLTSAGGKRNLGVGGRNRAFLSVHKTGLAFDQATYAACVNPGEDPLVIVPDRAQSPDGRMFDAFRSYARVQQDGPLVADRVLTAMRWSNGTLHPVRVHGLFMDLTMAFADEGWGRIPKRGTSRGGLEFWHYQRHRGLLVGKTTFGELLAAFWPMDELKRSKEWRHYRDATFTGLGFSKG